VTSALIQNAWRAYQAGNRSETARLCREILRTSPKDFTALYLLGFTHYQTGNLQEAEQLIGEAIKSNPDSTDASYNRGCILQALSRYSEALVCFDKALSLNPRFLDAMVNRGIILMALRRHSEALASFDAAVGLKSDDSEIWNNRATALLEVGRPGDALADLGRALALNAKNSDAWSNRGVALQRLKRHLEALASFGKALAVKQDSHGALTNRASTLMELHRYQDALKDVDLALAIKPDYVEALVNRGVALVALKDYENGLSSLTRALQLRPDSSEALFARINALMVMKRFEEAAADCEALLKLDPDYKYVRGFLTFFRLQCCDWGDLDAQREDIHTAIEAEKRVVAPFANVTISADPQDQLTCARICVADRYPAPLHSLWQGERYDHKRIRVAYVSGDFNNSAVATLMARVFELHDRARFEIAAISLSQGDKSDMRTRVRRAFDRFNDVWSVSDGEIAALLRQMEPDIVVDLSGFTGVSRPGIFALRPAPVQVNFLGFPGTMGADYFDYIIADKFVIPKESRQFYDEAVVHLPDCYLPNDSLRRIAEKTPTRGECGLPENGFVFCSFNNSYKFTPEAFDVWMRLLAKIEGSVLWLSEVNPAAVRNLRREAQSRNVAPERLIFAPFLPSAESHLARLRLGDLFLDTLPYNAHTTAADALWAGLPLLTMLGTTFAGRVAGSLLHAVGLPELVTNSADEYESLALKLASEPGALVEIKAKLRANRDTQPLFDSMRYTKNLEAAYAQMWERSQRSERAKFLAVEPVT
jgi:protein O-GlcNAc transferase